jgi:hypothetical protein
MTHSRLPMKPSWSCSTNYGPARGLEEYCSGPLAVSPATKHSPTTLSGYCGDHNSRGYAAGNAAQLGCEGNRLSRRPDREESPWTAVGVTAGETAQISVWVAVATAGRSRGTAASRLRTGSATQFSSSDGLGNHQPGSMTCGFLAFRGQPASGRARDRAICLTAFAAAVARFNRRAA